MFLQVPSGTAVTPPPCRRLGFPKLEITPSSAVASVVVTSLGPPAFVPAAGPSAPAQGRCLPAHPGNVAEWHRPDELTVFCSKNRAYPQS